MILDVDTTNLTYQAVPKLYAVVIWVVLITAILQQAAMCVTMAISHPAIVLDMR
ncbi:hypothetical protein Lfee_0489 [Legionella feeleii]|uniref:Uncharacterized protein n=1 Tax=Legionella feeleii TaxID=453 RepID=A0A0W0U674_9GAMM|nr:hypothetical protein Lfee_0489 [Legionella feeleii]SPX61382.1 Uncharacterised protein [Legionella feeleii]